MKQIVKKFNNLIRTTIFKVQNKTNDNFKISNFNKCLITFITLLFLYLFYLLLPILYDKTWVQSNIEKKLLEEFKINLSTSSNISYRILPSPHFLIKDSKILVTDDEKQKSIAEIKDLQVFLKQGNFFDKEEMQLKEIIIDNANFSLLRNDYQLLDKYNNNQFFNNKITINKSNIFFKDSLGKTITIIKISKAFLFFDELKLLNLFNLKGEVFKIPFTLDYENTVNSLKTKKINISAKTLKLKILNESTKVKKNSAIGKNIISFLNSTIYTNYNTKKNLITFESGNSRLNNSKVNYNGELSINPFDLKLNINLDNYEISKILNVKSILTELVKTELLFNENISVGIFIFSTPNAKKEIFQNIKINFNIVDGKINFNKTKLIIKNIGSLEIDNSNLFFDNDKLVLNANIKIKILNSDNLFSFLQTNKKSRKKIQDILINLDYDFLGNEFEFNNIKIDNNEVNDELFTIMESFNDNSPNNLNKSRRLLNELLSAYDG